MELEVCSVNGKDEDNLKKLEELFDQYGKEGFELVSHSAETGRTTTHWFAFKRQVP